MSRIGKKGIAVPDKTTVAVANGVVTVTGPKGTLERTFRSDIKISVADNHVSVEPVRINKQTAALWGTYASHIQNMVKGVNTPYEKKLILEGVGYKSEVKGDKLQLALGFSHPVFVQIPKGIEVKAEKNLLTFTGIDKELLGRFVAEVRALKKPEPYKGKGFRYQDEVIRRKQGKKSV